MSAKMLTYTKHDERGWRVVVEVDGQIAEEIEASSADHAEAIMDDIVTMAVQVGGHRVASDN